MTILGVGIDLVDLARAERMLDRHGGHALSRLLTAGERASLGSGEVRVARFAARLAAKEAAWKALAPLHAGRTLGWQDLEVVREDGAPPRLVLRGRAAPLLADHPGLQLHLSLTHSRRSAAAVVIGAISMLVVRRRRHA